MDEAIEHGDVDSGDEPDGEMPAPENVEKPKKAVHRKPLWLAVPVEWKDTVDDGGDITSEPARYELHRCATKSEVAEKLAVYQKQGTDGRVVIDGLNAHHVKVFRADPLPMKISKQVAIKF